MRIMIEEVCGKLSPVKLAKNACAGFFNVTRCILNGVKKFAWTELAEVEVGRESAGAIRAGDVAVGVIGVAFAR